MSSRLLVLSLTVLATAACGADPTQDPLAPPALAPSAPVAAKAATKDLRIHGTLEARETGVFYPDRIDDRLVGTGTASHLGRYTVLFYPLTVNTVLGTSVGQATITAANGDVLTGSIAGVGQPAGPGFADIQETVTITGGTGRFDGATGTLIFVRRLDQTTGLSSGTFDGTIIVPH